MGQLLIASAAGSTMLVLWCLVHLLCLVQSLPTFNLQGYPAVPALAAHSGPLYSPRVRLLGVAPLPVKPYYIPDTAEVAQAKGEFMQAFQRALNGLLYELAPSPVQAEYLDDTPEVKEAKEQFFRTFNNALNGIIETIYIDDTAEVKEKKEEFFEAFDSAMNNLLTTVETAYLEITPEVKEATVRFNQAFADAKEGKVGAQYIEDTPEVKAAKQRFFQFFDFVLDGMLDKLSPKPGNNVIPEEIADFYIKDEPDVAEEKRKLDKQYLDAVSELDETLQAIENVLETDENNAIVEDESAVIEA